MKNNFIKQKGFTLIELLIYIAILAIITTAVADSFIILNKGRARVEAQGELNANLRFIMEKIKREITSASNVAFPINAGESSNYLDVVVGGDVIRYSLSNDQLTRKVNSQPAEVIGSDKIKINNLIFTRIENQNTILDKKMVSIQLSISESYNSTSPDWLFTQTKKTSIDLPFIL